ncbi:MAG: AraC family transcriptional regulator [Pirellulales bacterium]|jgi:AraC-like DNA-binding protein
MRKTNRSRVAEKKLPAFVSRQVATSQRYFVDLLPDRSQTLAVACGGYEHVRKDYVISRNDFPYFCIEFVCAGKGKVWFGESAADGIAQEAVPIHAGTLFAYGPGMPHRIETDPRQLLRKHYVDFVGRQAGSRLRRMGLTAGSVMRVSHPDEVREIFDLMLRCGSPPSVHSEILCTQLLGVLLAKVNQRILREGPIDDRAFKSYEQFRRILVDRCVEWQSVEAACAVAGISPEYACRLFVRFGEDSPYRLLTRQRMSLAAEWLAHEQVLVREAARRLGYPDQYQFSRTFKRVFGIAPAGFRRGHRIAKHPAT